MYPFSTEEQCQQESTSYKTKGAEEVQNKIEIPHTIRSITVACAVTKEVSNCA